MTPALDYQQFSEGSLADFVPEQPVPATFTVEDGELSAPMRELRQAEADRWRAMRDETRSKLNGSGLFGRLFHRH
ncbi:MAG TPA: hypothetical protein VHX60_15825 [Acidobacteriaceae bacterium]|jgi:hypothetical protein|nr:hypothetical protein [Acidobacteriaceae bacterium]